MKHSLRLWVSALCLMGLSLALWNCNVNEAGGGYILQLKLDDSLAVDAGKYDQVVVDLCDTNRTKKIEKVFNKAYVKSTDSIKLANLPLPSKPPNPLVIQITAFKNGKALFMYEIMVKDLTPVRYPPIALNAQRSVTIQEPSVPDLYLGAPPVSLKAIHYPADSNVTVLWTVTAGTGTAEIVGGNQIRGLTPGTLTLTATASGTPPATASLTMTVKPAPTAKPVSITFSKPSPLKLKMGETMALTAVVHPDSADQRVQWSVQTTGIVDLAGNGNLKTLAVGFARIWAVSKVDSTVTAFLDVEVGAAVNSTDPKPAPKSIVLLMTTPMILAEGDSPASLLASVLPEGANDTLLWTSLNSGIALVTADNKVKPVKAGTTRFTATSKADPTVDTSFQVQVVTPVKVDSLTLTPKSLTLYTGGPEVKLNVTLTGSDTGAHYTLASSNALIASVSSAGSVKGLAAGSAVITASVVGYPLITSICSVKVVKDPPVVTVSPNQNVAFNGEAVFTVSVAPQGYGTTVEIKADMDGDNVYEQTVLNKETADFKHKYTEVKTTTVSFKVKDTEGNEETVTRKVTVGAPGAPVISIINPSKDTIINVLSLKIRFTIKDTAQKIDTFVDSTVVLVAGSNKITASRTDDGGVGSDVVTILVDNTAPTVTITGPATQNAGVAAFTLAGTAADAGSGLLSVTITGALSGNGAATLTAGEWSKGGLTLAEGLNTLVATALDKAGNSKPASITVTLDSKKPGVPVVTAPAAVRAGPIKWTWVKANSDGSGKFKVKINGGPEIDAAQVEYTLAAADMMDGTVYGLSVKETDPVAGDGPWSAEKKVLFDSKKPSPSINVTATPTKTPEWQWTSNGGIGTFRWHYKGQTAGSAGTGAAKTFTPTNLATGSHTLCVQEKDSPEWGEEWGTETCALVVVDKDGPSIIDIQPPDGFVTNQKTITITFKAGTEAKSYVCILGLDNAENPCNLTASDALGNTTTVARKIWRRSKVVFVRKDASGSGISFDDAFGSVRQALSQLGSDQNQVWIMEGSYPMTGTPGPYVPSGVSIYGGFSTARNQESIEKRNASSNRTVLSSLSAVAGDNFSREIFNIRNENESPVSNIKLDGMTISAGYYGLNIDKGSAITLSNMKFSNSSANPLVGIGNSTVTLNDCDFSNNSGEALTIDGNTVTLNRCNFSNNQSVSGGFYLRSGKVIVNNSTFKNTAGFSGFQYWISVSIDSSTPILEMYNNTIQGYGTNPGPIVTNQGDMFTVIGSGNHP
ncbi:MAG: Ig-like domain-containing protein [Fibrobacteria bacterium]